MPKETTTAEVKVAPGARNPNPAPKHPFHPNPTELAAQTVKPEARNPGGPYWPPIKWMSAGILDLSLQEGAIVRLAGDPTEAQYLIMGGAKRWISDGQTFINLFTIHAARTIFVTTTAEWNSAPLGTPIPTCSFLATAQGYGIYFIDGIYKRWIINPQMQTLYQFLGEVRLLSPDQFNLFPDGPNV